MKTLVLTLTMLASISAVKAQQWQPQANNKSPLSIYKFKLDTTYNDLFKKNLTVPGKTGSLFAAPLNEIVAINMDRMPVAKLRNTDPGTPIVQTDKTGYNMPIVGKNSSRSYTTYSPIYTPDGKTLVIPSK